MTGLYFTYLNVRTAQENLRVTEEGKLTDRFSKAVELLGSENLDVRLGGIYALERVARDSQKDHWTVMEVLTTFVRENAPYKPYEEGDLEEPAKPKPREDIQAIMTVISRRKWRETEDRQWLNLQGVNLAGCHLKLAILYGANLSGANLSEAQLSGANLSFADLSRAKLREVDLSRADLSGANLKEADLRGADLK